MSFGEKARQVVFGKIIQLDPGVAGERVVIPVVEAEAVGEVGLRKG